MCYTGIWSLVSTGTSSNEHVSLSYEARSCRALWISMIACAPGPTPSPLDILHGARGTWTATSSLVEKRLIGRLPYQRVVAMCRMAFSIFRGSHKTGLKVQIVNLRQLLCPGGQLTKQCW